MSAHRHVGLERVDGDDVGRDPRAMSIDELERLGHARVSPLRALRLKCLDCCNGSTREVRLCAAVDCPSWPFRMGVSPWRAPLTGEARSRRAAGLALNRASARKYTDETQGRIGADDAHGGGQPEASAADWPLRTLGEIPETGDRRDAPLQRRVPATASREARRRERDPSIALIAC